MCDATPKTKPKLLVILGAGSSVELGMPSVKEIDGLMRRWAREYARERQQTDFYRLVWQNRICHLANLKRRRAEVVAWDSIAPNYERCLADLHALMNGSMPILFGGRHSLALAHALGLNHVENPPKDLWGKVYGTVAELLGRLSDEFRERCCYFAWDRKASTEFDRYRALLAVLCEQFDLGVYSLNHDTIALTALEGIYTGFARTNGCFEAATVQNRCEWNYLYYLHGSVHYSLIDADGGATTGIGACEIRWSPTPTRQRILPTKYVTEQRWIVSAPIVAGGWKLDQLQTEPFQTFYSTLPRHAHEADAILIAGYGFGDEHVNSVLRNVLSSKESSRPRILILDSVKPEDRPMADHRLFGEELFEDARWNHELRRALSIGPQDSFYRAKDLAAPCPDLEISEDRIEKNEYAICMERETAVWFGGMPPRTMEMTDDVFERWVSSLTNWLRRHVPER